MISFLSLQDNLKHNTLSPQADLNVKLLNNKTSQSGRTYSVLHFNHNFRNLVLFQHKSGKAELCLNPFVNRLPADSSEVNENTGQKKAKNLKKTFDRIINPNISATDLKNAIGE